MNSAAAKAESGKKLLSEENQPLASDSGKPKFKFEDLDHQSAEMPLNLDLDGVG